MRIVAKSLNEYSNEELKNERSTLVMRLCDCGVTPALKSVHWKDRQRKTTKYQSDLSRLVQINKKLGYEGKDMDVYERLLDDSISGSDLD